MTKWNGQKLMKTFGDEIQHGLQLFILNAEYIRGHLVLNLNLKKEI